MYSNYLLISQKNSKIYYNLYEENEVLGMYAYLKGFVKEILPNSIVLEVNDIGYQVFVPNSYDYKLEEFTIVYIHQAIKEDSNFLYGFRQKDEKEMFLKLISVSGIGPKSALSIMASGTVNEIASAIEAGDSKKLTKFPGIGPKAASQIILDLKGKLIVDTPLINTDYDDVRDALIALGYKQKDVEKVLPKLSGTTSEMIKQALQMMLR